MVAGSIKNVQTVCLSFDTVNLPVKVLNGWRVSVIKLIVQKSRHQRGLAHFTGAQYDKSLAVLGRRRVPLLYQGHFSGGCHLWGPARARPLLLVLKRFRALWIPPP